MSRAGRTVVAALDTAAAAPVLAAARQVAATAQAGLEAVHVGGGRTEVLEGLARRSGVPLRRLASPVEWALLHAAEAPEVVVLVLGSRVVPESRRPVGRTVRQVVARTTKPVLVVPPDVPSGGGWRRALVPLEGTERTSRPVLEVLGSLLGEGVEPVVLHVFTRDTVPRMLDRPHYDLDLLGREFLATHFPVACRVELRPGPVADRVAEASAEHGVDLVVLSWSQDASPGRAAVVQSVLGESSLPVLLLPAAAGPSTPGEARTGR